MPVDDSRFARRVLIAVAITVGAAILLTLLRSLTHILLVFFAGVLFAVMLAGLSRLGERYLRLPHGPALALVCLLLIGLAVGVSALIGPQLGQQLAELGRQLPEAVDQAADRLRQYDWIGQLLQALPEPDQALGGDVLGRVTGIFSTAFGALANVIIVVFVGLYLAAKPGLYIEVVLRLVPAAARPRGRHMFAVMGNALTRWLLGRLVTMIFIGAGTTLALWSVGMPLAFSLGLIAGLLNFIPYLGPVLSAVPAVLIAFADGPQMALYVALIYLGVQAVESYLVDPLVERRAVYIPPAFQITLQLIAGVTAGFLGLLLATPLVVVLTVAFQMLYLEDVLGEQTDVIGER